MFRPPKSAAVLCALALSAAMPCAHADAQNTGGHSVQTGVDFTIKIPVVFRFKVQQQQPLRVTPEDIARGYVETVAPQEVRVVFNLPQSYTLRMDLMVPAFRRVTVSEQYASRSFGAEGLTLLEPPTPPSTHETDHRFLYRFELSPGMTPGNYPWPVAVSAVQT